jgi:hypothetical protein
MDVSPFANRSTTPDAGAVVAARLREELRRSGFQGSFVSVGPDYLIEGKVREVRSDIFSRGADRFSLENRLTLVVDIRVVEVVRGGVLWKESGLSETASFFSGTDAQYTEANRRAAFEEVARRMAVRLSQILRVLL